MPTIVQGPTSERQGRARARIAAQERHRRVCRELERLAPLTCYYGPQPLLAVPIAHYYVRGRWAA